MFSKMFLAYEYSDLLLLIRQEISVLETNPERLFLFYECKNEYTR